MSASKSSKAALLSPPPLPPPPSSSSSSVHQVMVDVKSGKVMGMTSLDALTAWRLAAEQGLKVSSLVHGCRARAQGRDSFHHCHTA
jgi:hypothetical protein